MNKIFVLLLAYKYTILVPFAIFEGPITTVIAGFLVSAGLMNPFVVYAIVVGTDVIGDALFYFIGYRGGGFIMKYGPRFGITKEKMDRTNDYFKENHRKAIVLAKLVHGIGFTGLITAGSLKVPYRRFFETCLFMSMIQSAFFLIIGIFFGGTYMQISKYLNYFAAIISVVALAIVVLIFYKRTDIQKLRTRRKVKDYE